MTRFTAFLDACVLVPIAPCDTLLRMADRGAFRPLWSERVEEEALRALCEIHTDVDPSRFHSRFRSMNEAFEDARIRGGKRSSKDWNCPTRTTAMFSLPRSAGGRMSL